MGRGLNNDSVVDITPMPNLILAGSRTFNGGTHTGKYAAVANFPVAAPSVGRVNGQGNVEKPGLISLSHNCTNAVPPSFVLCAWSEILGYWVTYEPRVCAAQGQIDWKVQPGTAFFIYSNVALTGATAIVAIGGASFLIR